MASSREKLHRSQVRLDNIRHFLIDTVLAFYFWSILTSLGPTIFWFPLWYMGLSGYEAFLFMTIMPIILVFPPVLDLFVRFRGFWHLLSMIGIAAWKVSDPTIRVTLIGIATGITTTIYASSWWSERHHPQRLERNASTILLGLIFSSVVRYAWYANNPIWPLMHAENGGVNTLGLLLGILASIEVIIRKKPTDERLIHPKDKDRDTAIDLKSEIGGTSIFAGVGIGTLIFALHSLLSDTTTIISWVWDGYPIHGPTVVPYGSLTIIAMALGLTVYTAQTKFVNTWMWFAIGTAATTILYSYNGWTGYYGGFVLSVYLVSIFPSFVLSASRYQPGLTFFLAYFTYNLFCLAHVWTVAYAFVPVGRQLRERTDWVLTAQVVGLAIGTLNVQRITAQGAKPRPISTHAHSEFAALRSLTKLTLGLFCFASVIIAYIRTPSSAPQPYHPKEKLFTAGIWTVHFGLDNDMWASEYRMRDIIQELELDVVGLLESDLQRVIMGYRDMTQFLGEELNMYVDYGPGPNKHTWGAALLSKFPILNSTHHLLPSPYGELAPAIHATLDVYGTEVDVIVSHNGQEEDELDRKLQTETLAKIMANAHPRPLIFLGYVVTKPKEGNYFKLFDDGKMNDIEPDDWDRWCEYIGYRGVKRVGYARVSHGQITDTEIQTGKFVIPDELQIAPSYSRVEESQVPFGYRYPPQFYGEGVRGHRFQTQTFKDNDVPLYYD